MSDSNGSNGAAATQATQQLQELAGENAELKQMVGEQQLLIRRLFVAIKQSQQPQRSAALSPPAPPGPVEAGAAEGGA